MAEIFDHSLDLPLMSSINSRHVHHYILDLNCDISQRIFTGSITLFSRSVKANKDEDIEKSFKLDQEVRPITDDFVLILDSWDLTIEKVEELSTSKLDDDAFLKELDKSELNEILVESQKHLLNFTCEKHCVRLWKTGVSCAENFPQIVRIIYRTNPSGESLKWTRYPVDKPWVYTHGHWINNRSWFPSQDIPTAMASWRAYVHAPKNLTVLMTGDVNAETWDKDSLYTTHYFYSKMEMPSSTLALAIGHWREVIKDDNISLEDNQNQGTKQKIPYRVFAPCSLTDIIKQNVMPYIPKCILAACDLLGSYPFHKLDVLIVPESFQSLGMASPSLMFLSQSVLSEDGGMLVRISHEISHSWFGLLIGPKDWTEEWLSEGFCTYTEGVVHTEALQMTKTEAKQRRELLDYMKYKNLQTELNITDLDLQTLRPNKDEQQLEKNGVLYVKNGMNPEKGFMQLHYIKGYFLLCFLESIVGLDNFCLYLKQVVERFHHQLVTSKDVLLLFIEMFPEECDGRITLDFICEEWLDNPGIPKFITSYIETVPESEMFKVVSYNLSIIKELNSSFKALHWRKKRKIDWSSVLRLKKMNTTQILLLLDMLVNEERIHTDVLQCLNNKLLLYSLNADILHKWCELVVKFKVLEWYECVKRFLINHQAMGVYLFGELILSRDKKQRKIAESAFDEIKDDLDAGVYQTICLMIYGKDEF